MFQCQNPGSGLCCVCGAPAIDVTLNKGLFTVGETILVQGEISNRTNTRIEYSTIALMQVRTQHYAMLFLNCC